MVKLEHANGFSVFIAPEHVVAINPAGVAGQTTIWDVGGAHTKVMGTPEEVHSKLFLPPPLSDVGAARRVLEWAARAEGPWEDDLRVLALKALGRD